MQTFYNVISNELPEYLSRFLATTVFRFISSGCRCLAIIHGNKNSRKVLKQQNKIQEYRHNEKKLAEYRKCLSETVYKLF